MSNNTGPLNVLQSEASGSLVVQMMQSNLLTWPAPMVTSWREVVGKGARALSPRWARRVLQELARCSTRRIPLMLR